MASTSSYLANLPQLPAVPGTEPDRCVLDSFRTAIAQIVADALPPLTVEQVYAGVDYGKKGVDFTVALPRFRLPGKVDEHAKKVLEKVSSWSRSSRTPPATTMPRQVYRVAITAADPPTLCAASRSRVMSHAYRIATRFNSRLMLTDVRSSNRMNG